MKPELENLRPAIAKALGWTVEDTRTFSISALRDILPETERKLKYELTIILQSGFHIYERYDRERRS
jgi:hypothetical protein